MSCCLSARSRCLQRLRLCLDLLLRQSRAPRCRVPPARAEALSAHPCQAAAGPRRLSWCRCLHPAVPASVLPSHLVQSDGHPVACYSVAAPVVSRVLPGPALGAGETEAQMVPGPSPRPRASPSLCQFEALLLVTLRHDPCAEAEPQKPSVTRNDSRAATGSPTACQWL